MAIKSLIKTEKMNTYKDVELYKIIKDNGSVTIDIVPFDGGEPTEKTFTNYDEAVSEITGLEYENEIYF
tara:strand:+ start:59 stop:265 length:207 start_codon:yes stop_codon:yes gene_type:complete